MMTNFETHQIFLRDIYGKLRSFLTESEKSLEKTASHIVPSLKAELNIASVVGHVQRW